MSELKYRGALFTEEELKAPLPLATPAIQSEAVLIQGTSVFWTDTAPNEKVRPFVLAYVCPQSP